MMAMGQLALVAIVIIRLSRVSSAPRWLTLSDTSDTQKDACARSGEHRTLWFDRGSTLLLAQRSRVQQRTSFGPDIGPIAGMGGEKCARRMVAGLTAKALSCAARAHVAT